MMENLGSSIRRARAFPKSDAQCLPANAVRRGQGVSRSSRLRLEKIEKYNTIRLGTWNVGSMTGRSREITDIMKERRVDILCVQETEWKGNRAREIGGGFKLIYYGRETRRNGVCIIVSEDVKSNVLDVKRVRGRIIKVKLMVKDRTVNIVSTYAPQTGCPEEDKQQCHAGRISLRLW